LVAIPQELFVLSATAARISALNALSSILSPSWISMARLTLPSRLVLNRPEGSLSEAPLAKVNFTALLYVSPVQMIPACSHTGTPQHRVRRLSPFHLLDHFGVGLSDETSDPSERLAAPIGERRDSCVDQLRRRASALCFLRAAFALLHGCRRFLHGCRLSTVT
jgi:hypothetical protein